MDGTVKKYRLLYADPPWAYRNKRTGDTMKSGVTDKYPTMNLAELEALPISSIAHKDSACFLWATVPLLPEAFTVLRGWGYKYKTALFWRKIMSLGMGFWFRGQVEVLLLGVRGKMKAFRIQKANIIQAKVGRHSEKPEEFRQLLEQIGLEPRIELFARKTSENWDVWGNEVESDIELYGWNRKGTESGN